MGANERVFRRGDRVFLASGGVATVAQFAARDAEGKPAPWTPEMGAPVFYVVEGDEVTACVPISRAAETLRPLVDPEVARQMLEALRSERPPEADSTLPLVERGKRIVHSGTPLEHAWFLRELYGLPAPVADAIGEGLLFMSRLVLSEIAAVLGLDRAQLEAEMRQRSPAFDEFAARNALRLRFHPGKP